jgi:ABC-2 type transport system permease protein
MNNMIWLVKREFWEHRGGFFWAPFWTGVAVLALTLVGLLAGEVGLMVHGAHGTFEVNGVASNLQDMLAHIGPQQVEQVAKVLAGSLYWLDFVFTFVIGIVLFFYLLGALYDDRRDRSVLFWKSLPVSDAATVISKALTAVVLIPLLVFAIFLCTWLLLMLMMSAVVLLHGGSPWQLIWGQSNLLPLLTLQIAALPAHMLLALLTAGWLLLCSAAVRSKPFLWAVLIPILAGIANGWIGLMGVPTVPSYLLWGEGIKRLLLGTILGPPNLIVAEAAFGRYHRVVVDWSTTWHGVADLYATPGMWIGAVVGIAMIAGAVWFRRRSSEA